MKGKSGNYYNYLAVLILMVMFGLAVGSMKNDSAIRDEMPHIVAGYSYWTQYDYRLNPEHPPLVKQLATLPLLFMKVNFPADDPAWKDEVNGQWNLGDTFLYKSGNDADKMLFWGRIPIVLLMIGAGLIVYLWAGEIFKSKVAGLIALLLFAFSPNIIAHGRFITTDMGITAFSLFALYSWWRFLKKPGYLTFSVAVLLQAGMHLAKFSSPLFFPVLGLMTLGAIWQFSPQWKVKKRILVYLGGIVAATVLAYLIVGGWYAVFMHRMPLEVQQRLIAESLYDDQFGGLGLASKLTALSNVSVLRPYVQYFLGFFMVAAHASYGHSTYFLGEVGQNWTHYYFVAYLLKEPLGSQILFYVAFLTSLGYLLFFLSSKQRHKKLFSFLKEYNVLISFLALIVAFLFLGMQAKLQLGIRYIVAIFPYLYILTGGFWALFLQNIEKKRRKKMYLVGNGFLFLMLGWLILANIRAFPFYLPYYNELIGGGQNGWRYLVDSNTDWGQDLRRLKDWVDEHNEYIATGCFEGSNGYYGPCYPIEKLKIDYFGGGNLDYYFGEGNYEAWGFDKGATTGWIAVSIDAIQWNSANTDNKPSYHWLTDNYEPVVQIGHSIFVYYLDKN